MVQMVKSRTFIRALVPIGIVALLVILIAAGAIATVRPIKDAQSVEAIANGGTAFSPAQYVQSIWESRVIPAANGTTLTLEKLIPALQKDPAQAEKDFGHNVGGAANFIVTLSGIVTKIDTSSPTGSITVNLPYTGGDLAVQVQVGPVILGTSLRDSMPFISFGQFLNQVQYGSVADELNSQVERSVVSKLDLKSLMSKKITIRGSFTYDGTNVKDILITPIVIAIG